MGRGKMRRSDSVIEWNWLADRFSDEADPEHRLLGLVQKLHLPFGILLQAARNAAEKVAADLGHLGPGRLAPLEFGSLIGRACVATMADPENIQRHDWAHVLAPISHIVKRTAPPTHRPV